MTLVDANVLLHAYNSSSSQHEAARRWLEGVLSGRGQVCIAWVTVLAFVRISTNPRAYPAPFLPGEASDIVSEWLRLPNVATLDPGDRHWEILRGLMTTGQTRGPLVMDAHLAALAIEHGAILATTDKDFARFPELNTLDPLSNSNRP